MNSIIFGIVIISITVYIIVSILMIKDKIIYYTGDNKIDIALDCSQDFKLFRDNFKKNNGSFPYMNPGDVKIGVVKDKNKKNTWTNSLCISGRT